MRIKLFVIALAFVAAPALADPRIIVVEDTTSVSGTTSVPEAPPATAPAPPADIPSTSPNGAQTPAPPARYSFRRVEDGFLRLDTQTGQVTLCSAHAVGWACQAVPEDRAALEQEIERLHDQIEHLRQENAALRALQASPPSAPPRPPGDLTPKSDQGGGLKMPTDEDIARARAAVENAWRRLMDMMKTLQDDMTRKN
jgi:hypothetical protein